MSSISYNHPNQLQQAPRRQPHQYPYHRRRGVYGGSSNSNNNYYNHRPNNYYQGGNYQPNYWYNSNYGNRGYRSRSPSYHGRPHYRPPSPHHHHRSYNYRSRYWYNRNYYNRQRSWSNNRYRRPRPVTLGDYYYPQQQQNSPSPPMTTNDNSSSNTLPQQQNLNSTQPFVVQQSNDQNQQQQQQQRTTTSSFKRRQRRNQQFQNNNNNNNNRFDILANDNDDNINDQDQDEPIDQQHILSSLPIMSNRKSKKTKFRYYLLQKKLLNHFITDVPNELFKLLQDKRASDGTKQFLYESAATYDEWIRAEYELDIWYHYEKLSNEKNFWPQEIISRMKGRKDALQLKSFIQKKINYYESIMNKCEAAMIKTSMNYSEFFAQIATRRKPVKRATTVSQTATTVTTTANTATTATTTDSVSTRLSFDIEKIETAIADYIKNHLQYVKKNSLVRCEMADAECKEYEALQAFKTIAQKQPIWNIHLMLKPKVLNWSKKNEHFHVIQKRIEYGLFPKFIANDKFSVKIDTKMHEQNENQSMYDEMRQITSFCQEKKMQFCYKVAACELNKAKDEIDIIIENAKPRMPVNHLEITEDNQLTTNNNNEEEKCYKGFQEYYDLLIQRLNLQSQQAGHFLEEERVEGDTHKEIAPAQMES